MENTEIQKTINGLLNEDTVKKRFNEILGEKSNAFISSVLNVVKNNAELLKADPKTILNAAVIAATLDLPIDPNLGFAAIIPYNSKVKGQDGKDTWVVKAQFQMMYKGFVQLAQRSGQYSTINACEIYDGEIISENRVTGEIMFDFSQKKSDRVIAYAAYFKLINGFEKTICWPIEKIDKHGKRFSKSYNKGYGLWKDDFQSMAIKTVLKNLISKFGPMTVDFQSAKAIKYDQAVIENEDTILYVDNENSEDTELPKTSIEAPDPFTKSDTKETEKKQDNESRQGKLL